MTEDGIVIRKKSGLYTKGVNVDELSTENTYIMSIYFAEEKQLKNNAYILACGLCIVDASTGQIIIHESHSSTISEAYTFEEIKTIIGIYMPAEIMIHYQINGKEKERSEEILSNLQLSNDEKSQIALKFIKYPSKESVFLKENHFNYTHQNKYFAAIFDGVDKSNAIEEVLDRKIYAGISSCFGIFERP